ncbi:Crp/Fnr family transcriptional regulator [uncultured Piscinibacter sp.]|uniref:Crp/Fnr family transcriptional regulator n=1 Tax=uncultured Piscinibacter sp. TaxID=1131835 RepID=UPI00260DE7B1|nr:Crp/Fnr family transcriptional regulator [uncultured Piscinibacter sp.]
MSHPPDAADAALLAALPPSLRLLAQRGEIKRFRKDQHLIEEGTHGDTLFVILAGRLRAYSADERGREIVYGIYGPGEYIGEMSLDGGPRSASVAALEPAVCAVITRHTLHEHIAAHPPFAFELIARVIGRARLATQSARDLALLDAYTRVARLLESLAAPQPDGSALIAGRLTHAEIAARVGCSREMVSRLLKDLERGRYLAAEGSGWRLARSLPRRW